MNPTKTLLLITLIGTFFCSSCIRYAFYQSPSTGNANSYHAIPIAADSLKSAIYVNGAASVGGMNDQLRDNLYSFQASIHRSNVIGKFRAYYGASLTMGSYNVSPYNYFTDTTVINNNPGNKFMGYYSIYGGISASAPLPRKGEWRYLGIEGSLNNEFGDYYQYRKNMPDSMSTTDDKKKYLGSLGLTSEFIFRYKKSGNKFGIKIAAGSYLRKLSYHQMNYNTQKPYDALIYFYNTYHYTFKRNTVYLQYSIATHAVQFQAGYNFRL